MTTPILVIAEINKGRIRPVTYELIAAALRIQKTATFFKAKDTAPTIQIVAVTDTPHPVCKALAKRTGLRVIGFEIPRQDDTIKGRVKLLQKYAIEASASHIIMADTSLGRNLAPGLAVRLKAASIPRICDIVSHDQSIAFVRPVLNNTKNMTVIPKPGRKVILTLTPGSFTPFSPDIGSLDPGRTEIRKAGLSKDAGNGIRHLGIKERPGDNKALKAARIVVAAGRGIKERENLDWIFKFSKCFADAAVGSSRPLVDMGWIGYGHQVGITGASVSPDLYIACGISGSSQHLAGMQNAKTVISINTNPTAPICRHSDLCIAEDAVEFMKAFLKISG